MELPNLFFNLHQPPYFLPILYHLDTNKISIKRSLHKGLERFLKIIFQVQNYLLRK